MEHRYTDKHTVDEAWDSMRTALDTHMPVAQKRRVIWWWFPLLAGVVMIGLWYFSNGVSADLEVPVQESTKQVEKVIASTEDTAVNPNENQIGKEASASINFEDNLNSNTKIEIEEKELTSSYKKQSQAISVDKTIAKAESNSSQNLNQNQNVKIGAPIKLETKPILNKTIAKPNESKSKIGKSSAGIGMTNITSVDLNRTQNSKTVKEVREIQKTNTQNDSFLAQDKVAIEKLNIRIKPISETLELKPVLPLGFEKSEGISDKMVWTSDNPKIWNWSLRSAVVFEPRIVYTAYQFEANVSRSLSSRWSIGVGAGIKAQWLNSIRYSENFQREFSSSTGVGNMQLPVEGNTESEETWPGSYVEGYLTNADSQFNTAFFSEQRDLYPTLYVPVFVDYKLSNRWTVQAGVNYNFSFSVASNNFNFHISPAFRLSKRWAVGVQMQHNTRQFKQYDAELGRNQAGMFLRYQI